MRVLRPAGAEDREQKRFVGREPELAEIRSAIDEAAGGRGRLLLVSGEPGIGKTRLADEAAGQAASRGMHVYWVDASRAEARLLTGRGFRSSAG
jgi:predicted ATP-dependent serine protease